MTGKASSRRLTNRRFRRAFKRGIDVGAKISGRLINRYRYGTGIGRAQCKQEAE